MLEPLRSILSSHRIILASGSPRRKEILQTALPFMNIEIIPSQGQYCMSSKLFFLLLRLFFSTSIQVNLCQKLLFLHQLTHNVKTDCLLNYKFNTLKSQAQNMGRTCCVQKLFLTFRTISVHKMFSPCSAKIRASDKDLPVMYFVGSFTINIFRKVQY